VAKKDKKEPRTPARFALGAQVRVKPGTTDPDFPDIPLGGWAGTKGCAEQGVVACPPHFLRLARCGFVALQEPHRVPVRFRFSSPAVPVDT